ncbi:MAG: competence/damage-inducible protein A [Elusimicrobiota bacterium]
MNEKVFFLAVGSELLSSKSNRYSPLLARKLFKLGLSLDGEITVADDLKAIKQAMAFCAGKAGIVIVTGGLGPTFDDLTRQALCAFSGKPLVHSPVIEKFLKKRYGLKELPENFLNQCLALRGAKLFENFNGTAFAQAISARGTLFILLPGPLREWEPIWESKVKHFLKKNFSATKIRTASYRLCGLKEMEVQKKAEPVMKEHPSASFTVLAGAGICEFSFACRNSAEFKLMKRKFSKAFSGYIYSTRGLNLAEELKKACDALHLSICAAESCTGGLISSLITDVPGSSSFYKGGVNCYSNYSKMKLLGVRETTLKNKGAVSEECATEMASGARKIFRSDFSLSVTGIAGPDGGSRKKPVGTVCFAFCSPVKIFSTTAFFRGDRQRIKNAAAYFALFELLKLVQSYNQGRNRKGFAKEKK